MKLIAQVKLNTTPEQLAALKKTIKQANVAGNYISNVAWESKTFSQYRLHKLVYHTVRDKFELTAQVVIRCIAKVADAYKLDRKRQRAFKPLGAITYDDRILRWYADKSEVSIWTVEGRMRISFVCGDKQRELLKTRQGESDLILFRDQLFLSATCEINEPIPTKGKDVLGLDFGIVNIAVDSDARIYSGKTVNNVRYRHRRLRAKLQSKGTKAAKRLLKKLSGKEARFARQVNHTISKQIVRLAKDTERYLAIEDLTGIRVRITARREQRAILHGWSFYQLRSFLEYKSKLAGVNLVLVDPRNTSRTCPACGCVDKHNRPNQSVFKCIQCGFSGLADYIAATNIRRGATVNSPYFSTRSVS
ncbi:MAG: IS200/IS605 family element transposase accessory protein TnpB [Chloroflexi bacterium]|nr:IS200/IS605 family element transposase accessory protein TnpB [Chloroflexota bacterium]